MSIHIMNAVWQHGPQDTSARMLLLAIADCANDQGEAFPSVALLGQKSCMSKSTVLRTLQALEAAGWFAVRRRSVQWDGDTHPRGNLYVVALEKLRLPAQKQAEVRTPRGVMVTPHNQQREVSKPASRGVMVTPHAEVCEVSKMGLRGVKREHPPTPPLVGEPSEPSQNPPTPQRGANDLDAEGELLETIRVQRASLPNLHDREAGRAELLRLQAKLLMLRRQRGVGLAPVPRVETLRDPPGDPPYERRRRRRGPSDGCSAEVGT